MAGRISTSAFETVIKLQLDRYSPEEAKRRHIAAAKAGLAVYLGTQTPRPAVKLEVDGHAAIERGSGQAVWHYRLSLPANARGGAIRAGQGA